MLLTKAEPQRRKERKAAQRVFSFMVSRAAVRGMGVLLLSFILLALSVGGYAVRAIPPYIRHWSDLVWSPDGNFLLAARNESADLYTGALNGSVMLYTREMQLVEQRFLYDHMTIDSINWSPDGTHFILSADDSPPEAETDAVIAIWAFPDFAIQREMLYGKYETDRPDDLETIANAMWHPDGRHIFSTVTRGGEMLLAQWDAVTLQPTLLPLERSPAFMRVLALSPNGGKLALSGVFGAAPETYFALQMLDSESGALLWEQHGGENVVTSISWLSENIFAAARGDLIEIWNAATGDLQQTLQAEPDAGVYRIQWSPDGRFIAVLNEYGGDLTIWSVGMGQQAAVVYDAIGASIGVVAFDWHPDGRSIAAALAGEWDLRLFDVAGIYGG